MNTEKNLNKRNGLYLAMVAAATLMLSACGDDNNDDNSTADISKPVMPAGMGFEQYVAAPDAVYPLPVILYGKNNGHSTLKYSIHDNPYPHALKGINSIWKGTSDAYQSAASGSERSGQL